jgi:hypothetical protein
MADKDYALQLHRTLFPALFDEQDSEPSSAGCTVDEPHEGRPAPTSHGPLDSPSEL